MITNYITTNKSNRNIDKLFTDIVKNNEIIITKLPHQQPFKIIIINIIELLINKNIQIYTKPFSLSLLLLFIGILLLLLSLLLK